MEHRPLGRRRGRRWAAWLGVLMGASALVRTSATSVDADDERRLLRQDDFHYLGYHRMHTGGELAELHYGQGFTHRDVDGRLHFLTYSFFGNVPGGGYHLIEVEAPDLNETTSRRTNHWPDVFGATGLTSSNGVWMGLWFDEVQRRLWTTWAVDYPDASTEGLTASLVSRTLNDDGTISDVRGPWGLDGVQQRALYGGMARVPPWFQTRYGVGPYLVGWGGYASRMSLGVSMGPTAFTIPDPQAFPDHTDLPVPTWKALIDHRTGTRDDDWYATGTPAAFDRGVRGADVQNEFDTGWKSPAPDGLGRWVWGDSAWNTGVWIDTGEAHGFVIVPKFYTGRAWYEGSTLHAEGQTNEVQVFDPAALGAAADGARAPWQVAPAERWDIGGLLREHGLGYGRSGNGPAGGVAGASFDAARSRLYLYAVGGARDDSYVFVFAMGRGPATSASEIRSSVISPAETGR